MNAFRAAMRQTVYGDIEPAHILEIAEGLKLDAARRNSDGEDWTFNLPKFEGDIDLVNRSPELKAFLKREQAKFYKAWDSHTEQVVLVENPAAWHWSMGQDGQVTWYRTKPRHTDEKIGRKNVWWRVSGSTHA